MQNNIIDLIKELILTTDKANNEMRKQQFASLERTIQEAVKKWNEEIKILIEQNNKQDERIDLIDKRLFTLEETLAHGRMKITWIKTILLAFYSFLIIILSNLSNILSFFKKP